MTEVELNHGRPHHWVTPFLGKRGQIGLSRHNFASTAPFPDLSTPLDSLYFSGSDGGLQDPKLGLKLVR